MQHYILAKLHEGTDVSALIALVSDLFQQVLSIPGIHSVSIKPSCSDRANRYDLMIRIDMEREALPAYDASAPHHQWKELYGSLIEKKAIFDCEDE